MSTTTHFPADKVEMDPKISLAPADDDDVDLASTPAADLVSNGLVGLVLALNLCPEAAASGKRTKQIHKKGEVAVEGPGDLKLKWNVDYKAGSVLNLRVVTLKGGKEAPPVDQEAVGAGAGAGAIASDGEVAPAPTVAGRKRARKEPTKPEDVDVKAYLQTAHEACVAQNKATEAEALAALLARF